jgi:signal peptidase II
MLYKKNIQPFVYFTVGAFLLDQISKILIVNSLSPFDPPLNIIGSVVRFKLTYNPYGVFSIAYGPPVLYFVLSIIGVIVLTLVSLSTKNRLNVIIFGIIVGGALGNIFDRVRLDYVVDFIDMGIGTLRWFTYNLADAFITVGALFLLGRELFSKKEEPDGGE